MKAYIATVLCGECKQVLAREIQTYFPPGELFVFCANPDCPEYEIRYKMPVVELERWWNWSGGSTMKNRQRRNDGL